MTLAEQLTCVEREIKRWAKMFPHPSHMTRAQVDHELACMRAVAETLRGLIDEVNMNEERLP